MAKSDKQITEWTISPSNDMEVVSARMGPNGLDNHFHDVWSIGAILEGTCSFRSDGRPYQAHKGDLFLIPPFEVHSCSAASANVQYVVLYIANEHLLKIDANRFFALADMPKRVLTAPSLVGHVAALGSGYIDPQRAESLLRAVAAILPAAPDAYMPERVPHPLQKVMHLVWQSDVEVGELEAHSQHSRWHTIRTFRRETGLSPSAYLRQLRVLKARLMFKEQASLADVAQLLYFSDQAHFTRVFKSVYGVTPGHLRSLILRGEGSAHRGG